MDERSFSQLMVDWCKSVVADYKARHIEQSMLELDRLIVESREKYSGAIPWRTKNRVWSWHPFPRQIDTVIGLKILLENKSTIIPLMVIELKAGENLNTDELDKKSAVYGPLRELYPWVHTVFIHQDITSRNIGDAYLLRNLRHFNTIYRHWNETTQALLRKLIYQQLEYQLEYWHL